MLQTLTKRISTISTTQITHMSRASASTSNVHQVSTTGFSGKDAAASYDSLRPSYGRDALHAIITPIVDAYEKAPFTFTPVGPEPILTAEPRLASHGSLKPMQVLELGAGTGISTRAIADCLYEDAAESVDFHIQAVDPSLDFCNQSKATLQDQSAKKPYYLDHITITQGSATSLNFRDNTFHGCIAAQCFHWFANNEALENIHRKLTPNGIFSVIWNNYVDPETWHGKVFLEIVQPLYFQHNVPHEQSGEAIKLLQESPLFSSLSHSTFNGQQDWLTVEQFKKRIFTISVLNNLKGDDKTQALAKIDEIMQAHTPENAPSMVKDGEDGIRRYLMKYKTFVVVAQKKHTCM